LRLGILDQVRKISHDFVDFGTDLTEISLAYQLEGGVFHFSDFILTKIKLKQLLSISQLLVDELVVVQKGLPTTFSISERGGYGVVKTFAIKRIQIPVDTLEWLKELVRNLLNGAVKVSLID